MKNRRPELLLPDPEARRLLAAKTRRGFLTGGAAALAGAGLYYWLTHASEDANQPWPQRRVLEWNERLATAYLSNHGQMPTFPRDQIGGVKPNGTYGLAADVSEKDWRVHVELEPGNTLATLSLADLKAMPKTELTTLFCCIEGWSGIAQWGGVRFDEFTRHVFPKGETLPPYVYMATPDAEYYVGLDMKSALHPQTVLAWEQNGKPLEVRRGAPLRLAIPVKYGIKNIKQVGLIRYTASRPPDYWAEEGYDWFAGL